MDIGQFVHDSELLFTADQSRFEGRQEHDVERLQAAGTEDISQDVERGCRGIQEEQGEPNQEIVHIIQICQLEGQ